MTSFFICFVLAHLYGLAASLNGNGTVSAISSEQKTRIVNSLMITKRLYVDAQRPLGGDGKTWSTAFKYLQDAIAGAPGLITGPDVNIEIWVAEGTYYPDEDEGGMVVNDQRTESFILINKVALYGGFQNGDNLLSKRNWIDHPTILSGNIGSPTPVIDNSYHVVYAVDVDNSALISGFQIKDGNANEVSGVNSFGGGIFMKNSAPIISFCQLTGNYATNGAGIFTDVSDPIIHNSIINLNQASSNGNASYNSRSNPYFINCTLINNVNSGTGGTGIYNFSSSGPNIIKIDNCILWNNATEITNSSSNDQTIVTFSIIEGGYAGVGNSAEDPLISGTFKLNNCSPAINAGNNAVSISTSDYFAKSRIQFGKIDIGADEFSSKTRIVYVDSSYVFSSNGNSWLSPYKYLYDALGDIPLCNNESIQIWVAKGTYFPDLSGLSSDPRDTAFTMINNVTIYGGFAGTETSLAQRNWQTNLTILSADVDEDGDNTTNLYHVIKNLYTASDTLSKTAVLDGFQISDGNANLVNIGKDGEGGGILNVYASPMVRNCTFYRNAADRGGAMSNSHSSPTLTSCTFLENTATFLGGGISNVSGSSPHITFCNFSNNIAKDPDPNNPGSGGGALHYNFDSAPFIEDCQFRNNLGEERGGAIWSTSKGTIDRCFFIANSAENGGAIYNVNNIANSNLIITDCQFDSNQVTQLVTISELYRGGAIYTIGGAPEIRNSTFTENNSQVSAGAIFIQSGSPLISHCNFTNNKAAPISGGSQPFVDYKGGAIHLDNMASPTISNCEFYGNQAEDFGGALHSESQLAEIVNCVFFNNEATLGRGSSIVSENSNTNIRNCSFSSFGIATMEALYAYAGGTTNLYNSVLFRNGNEIDFNSGAYIEAVNCIIEGGYIFGLNILDVDPKFNNAAIGDLTLQSCSPAIDVGNNAYNSLLLDLVNNPRLHDATSNGTAVIDLGPYEFQETFTLQCPCQDHLNLTGTIPSGTYEANLSISCDGLIEAGSNVIFNAPVQNLSLSFEVQSTAIFETQTLGCNN
jgi:predicted outer membrane repeat protein